MGGPLAISFVRRAPKNVTLALLNSARLGEPASESSDLRRVGHAFSRQEFTECLVKLVASPPWR
jgi:hypothetical protein